MMRASFLGFAVVGAMLILSLTACEDRTEKSEKVVVGIVNVTPTLEDTVTGLKIGLASLGYQENDNISYIYEGPLGSMGKVNEAVKRVLAGKPDLIVSFTTPVTLKIKKATSGMDIPVLFAPSADPVGAGLVRSLKSPGGHFTGIQDRGAGFKALDWLSRMVPGLHRLYVPFKPDDKSMVMNMKVLQKALVGRNIEPELVEFHSREDLSKVLDGIPDRAQAVWQLASSFWGAHMDPFVAACLEHKMPLKTHGSDWVKAGALMSYGLNARAMGEQLSHPAYKILKGTSPAVIPVEQVEFFLAINLKTARLIGLQIPDAVLKQADDIIR